MENKRDWFIVGGVVLAILAVALFFGLRTTPQETSTVEREPAVVAEQAWESMVEQNRAIGVNEEDLPMDEEFKKNFECAFEATVDELSDEAIVGLQKGDPNNIPAEDNQKFSEAWVKCAGTE